MKPNTETLCRPFFPTVPGGGPSEDSFSDLIRRHGNRIYNFAYRLSGNDPDARDLVQEALLRAFDHRDRYDPTKPFHSWVMGILRNVFVDGMRRYERRHVVSLHASPPTARATAWNRPPPPRPRNRR